MTQDLDNGWDTYDSVVVCAENEDAARMIHPSKRVTTWSGEEHKAVHDYFTWIPFDRIGELKITLIGTAASDIKKGVILASFNAG